MELLQNSLLKIENLRNSTTCNEEEGETDGFETIAQIETSFVSPFVHLYFVMLFVAIISLLQAYSFMLHTAVQKITSK